MMTPQTSDQLFAEGMDAFKAQNFKRAADCLAEVIKTDPLNWPARLYLGVSLFHIGDHAVAERQFLFIKNCGTDESVKQQAEQALSALNSSRLSSGVMKAFPKM